MTMLFDDEANREVLFGADGLLDALAPWRTAHIAFNHQRGAL